MTGFLRSLAALLTVFGMTGCSEWPPHSDELTTYVNDHKGQIEALVKEFQESDFGRINCSRCTREGVELDDATDSERLIDGLWRPVENPRGKHFAGLLKAAGVWGVSKRSGGEVELIIPFSSGIDDPRYVIQVFHDPVHSDDDLKECVGEFQKIDCGWCKVTIDQNLWIRYGWWPEDPDPGSTRARDEGEISWDEWERRNDKAVKTCEIQGLLEQGYSLPDSE
ncbi:hypothetical protein [Lentisalinibacter sediminis]|uniref:hypothetical protein n=1 Tax=Lentisalinibacter sediminis TaxID=2992237 RepID=UPI0038647E9C